MIVSSFISSEIFPLKKTDTCEMALVCMEDWRTFNLPVSDNGKFIGYVSFDKLSEAAGTEKIEPFVEPLIQLYALQSNHIFEVIQQLAQSNYTCLAVSDEEQNYNGAVSVNEILAVYKNSSLTQPGAIVTLTMNPQDYSLSELARVVEYNDCKILHVFIHPDPGNSGKINVSIKLNKQNIHTVIQTLERYQYSIQSVHQVDEHDADLHNRYDWLIKYLNT
jgi:acetoin utilization protein AcuB